jgi:UDP-glucose 4-epimerase
LFFLPSFINFNVTVLDKVKPKNRNIKFIKTDLSNLKILKKVTKKIDCIYHLAGVSDINKVKKMPAETIRDNVLCTSNLLEASRINKVKRFIFASSIYANSSRGNLYTSSKIAAENIIKNYFTLFKLRYTILRYATVYGTNNRGADVISIFLKKASKNQNIFVHSNGRQTRDFIHAEDLAECSLKVLKKKYENKTLIIGNRKKIKIIYVAKLIKKLANSKSKIIINKKSKREDDFNLEEIKTIPKKMYLVFKSKYLLKQGITNFLKENK